MLKYKVFEVWDYI